MATIYNKIVKKLFVKNKKCIINTDLDGILSGMLLKKFLNWEVVGYSNCCGRVEDNLWLKNGITDIEECIFVDLPVIMKEFSTIDQHFVAFDDDNIISYNAGENKINPNIICSRTYIKNDYTKKYPFGTVHFILAVLERLGIIPDDYRIDFYKSIGTFDLSDLFLRADRVVGNTFFYTQNCLWWNNWIKNCGGSLTKTLFDIAEKEYKVRKEAEQNVERCLKEFGCAGIDGECSNLFRKRDNTKLKEYFDFLSSAFGLESLPVFDYYSYDKLYGERIMIENNLNEIKGIIKREDLFSYAFVSMRVLSVTYKRRK